MTPVTCLDALANSWRSRERDHSKKKKKMVDAKAKITFESKVHSKVISGSRFVSTWFLLICLISI
jgi:hypothetical protein